MPTNWSRRFKNHVEKLKSGDIYQVAEVVRNLTIREKDKGLSAGEKRMLGKARQILVSELTFALKLDEETAEAKLDEVLGKGEPAVAIDDESMPDRTPVSKTPAKKPVKAKAPAKAAKAPAKKAAKPKAPAKAK
jgi:CarD family transcriptional regulator